MEQLAESFTFTRVGFHEDRISEACGITGVQLVRTDGTTAVLLGTTAEMVTFDLTLQRLIAGRLMTEAQQEVDDLVADIEARGGPRVVGSTMPGVILIQQTARAIERRDAAVTNVARLEAEDLRRRAQS